MGGGIAAGLLSMWSQLGWSIPHIGASGAISAVMGAYMVFERHKPFYFWMIRILLFWRMIGISAWFYLLFWFIFQVVSLQIGNPLVDYWAHLGGFAFGFTFALLFNLLRKSKQQLRWKKRLET